VEFGCIDIENVGKPLLRNFGNTAHIHMCQYF